MKNSRFFMGTMTPAMLILSLSLLTAGCQQQDRKLRSRSDRAVATASEALEKAKAVESQVAALQARLDKAMKQMAQQADQMENAARTARQSAITARDAAERAETAALKSEKIFERSLMK